MRKQKRIYGKGVNAIQYKHGQCINKISRLYAVWSHMIYRCEKKNDPAYKNYGGRGISVCDEWHDPKIFFEWALNSGYSDNLTIDRIENNGNYCPENCQFITLRENVMKRPKKEGWGVYFTRHGAWEIVIGKRINGIDYLIRGGTVSDKNTAIKRRNMLYENLNLITL